jgi:hypothetical protein
MPTSKVCFPMMMLISILLPGAKVWSQAAPAPRFHEFDTVEISALALALEINAVTNEVTPAPSTALTDIVLLRPESLLTPDGGKSWVMLVPGKKGMFEVDRTKYDLGPPDLETAAKLLAKEYVAAWITCMREAGVGKGSRNSILQLARRIGRQPPEVQEIMRANLGARLLALVDQNREWRDLMYGEATPKPIVQALTAYRRIEMTKIQAINAYPRSESFRDIPFVEAFDGAQVTWQDFGSHVTSGRRHRWGKIIRWSLGDDENVQQVRSLKEADICTLPLSSDHHVILRGEFADEDIRGLEEAQSLLELIRKAETESIQVFLSRPGSSCVGVRAGL